jgi:GT2 family glycosyltransferase
MTNSPTTKIAVLVKTYLRNGVIQQLVQSLQDYCDLPYRLYVADEQPVSEEKLRIYEQLKDSGHVVLIFDEPQAVSVCYARNRLLDMLRDEPFVLRLDDDFHFCPGTKISRLLTILSTRPEVGAVSDVEIQSVDGKKLKAGDLSAGQGHFHLGNRGKSLLKLPVPVDQWHWRTTEGVRFAYADFTRNFLLIRREVFQSVRWNERLQIHGEHSDFMLRLKKAGWLLAFTPDSVHLHNEPPKDEISVEYRLARDSANGKEAMRQVFRDTWGIDSVVEFAPMRDPGRHGWKVWIKRRILETFRRIKLTA